MSFILRLLSSSFGHWIIIGSLLSAFCAGGYLVHRLDLASRASELNAALVRRDVNDGKAHNAEIKIRALPDGASSSELFQKWNRNTD